MEIMRAIIQLMHITLEILFHSTEKADDDARTKHWYTQLQYHAQGTGAWRKRRTALANIMINGMMLRS